MSFLKVDSLSKFYDTKTVFKDLSFEVEQGQCQLITGSNGSGKSTLLACIAGLLQPDAGKIEVESFAVWKSGGFSKLKDIGLGYLPSVNLLYANLTVKENLAVFAKLSRRDCSEVDSLIESLGLSKQEHKTLRTCSQGIARRTGLARALLCSKKLLILDEPFANLDEDAITLGKQVLKDKIEQGVTLLISTHRYELFSDLRVAELRLN